MCAFILKRDVSDATKRNVLANADGCEYCGDRVADLVVDHRRPLSRGGTNKRSNLTAACLACNSQKRAMLLHEWRGYRKANGMPWPPIASHATDPVHYCDMDSDCSRMFYVLDRAGHEMVLPDHHFVAAPYSLEYRVNGGIRAHYRCPIGHTWTCGWAIATWYFSDCECMFCQVARDDNEEETHIRPARYTEVPADLKAALTYQGYWPLPSEAFARSRTATP